MQKLNYYGMKLAEEINTAIAQLPTAKMVNLLAEIDKDDNGNLSLENVTNFRGVRVTDNKGKVKYVNCLTARYKLVQHSEAFRPIIEGLTQAGHHDFKFVLTADEKKANLQIYATGEGFDTVSLGFSCENSFDGNRALSYGLRMFGEQKWIEIVGYRQVCSNGMKMQVPLDQAEFVRPELKSKITELMSERARILHKGKVEEKLKAIQYVVEAMTLLREPVELVIRKAKKWEIKDEQHLKDLIKGHVGKRFAKKVTDQYNETEGTDLWALYNSITFVASHDSELKQSGRETLLNKASELLTMQLF